MLCNSFKAVIMIVLLHLLENTLLIILTCCHICMLTRFVYYRCIVTELSKPWTPSIMKSISTFLCHLFDSVRRRQYYSRFYIMYRQLNIHLYTILVGVGDETLVQGYTEEWMNYGYINDPSHVSAAFLCSHNTEYKAVLSSCSDTISIRGIEVLHLIYTRNKEMYAHSVVQQDRIGDLLTCAIDHYTQDGGR